MMLLYIFVVPKFEKRHWDQKYIVKVFQPYKHLSRHAPTFPPGYWNIQELSYRLWGSRAQQEQLKE